MKNFLLPLFLISLLSLNSPTNIYSCADGNIVFTSAAPLEVIKAESNQLRGAIDISARTFLFAIDVNSFKGFNSGLQREHFSENYLETNKYPQATFKGKFIEETDFTKDGVYEIRAKGLLSLHGVEQERIIKGTISVSGGALTLHAVFSVLLEDHNIKIPRVVYQKISPEIEVTINTILKPSK